MFTDGDYMNSYLQECQMQNLGSIPLQAERRRIKHSLNMNSSVCVPPTQQVWSFKKPPL